MSKKNKLENEKIMNNSLKHFNQLVNLYKINLKENKKSKLKEDLYKNYKDYNTLKENLKSVLDLDNDWGDEYGTKTDIKIKKSDIQNLKFYTGSSETESPDGDILSFCLIKQDKNTIAWIIVNRYYEEKF